jgi:vacuolar-type H+-ATPase subunit E/Vma4
MTAAGHSVQAPKVTISETALPSKSVAGGVILSALNGRIILNQTLDE